MTVQPQAAPTATLADVVIEMGELALAFGRINRTAVYHPDGVTPESDTDHTVMLGWVACALAAQYFPDELNQGLVAQFALVHDAPEVYAGDTPTLRIDADGRAAKAAREKAATERLWAEFGQRLAWLPAALCLYEEQELPEARFVRGVDKILPKIVHLLDGCQGLREQGLSVEELTAVFEEQRAAMEGYVGEFTELLDLRTELVARTVAAHRHGLDVADLEDDFWAGLPPIAVRFWKCLNPDHGTVRWDGDVAVCTDCGLTSEMTRRYAKGVKAAVLAKKAKGL